MTPSTRREFLQASMAVGATAWAAASRLRALTAGGEQPNVVLLMLDALRPDYTQAYGAARETSPWLKRFAQDATVFDRCWSTSTWTAPACASLFSGLYPTEHGIVEGLMAHSRRKERQEDKGVAEIAPQGQRINAFAPDMVLLPQYLREFGYRCFGVATNPNIGPQIGFDRGFEKFIAQPEGTADQVAAWAEPWREELSSGEHPYFLYLHYMDVHKPYNRRAPWYRPPGGDGLDPGEARSEAEEAAEAYRSELRFLDEHLAALEQAWGWGDDTLVIVVSDHGEEFGEHGGIGHPFQMHAELNRILLMARGPGVQAQRVATPVAIHDLLPTLLDWLKLAPPVESSGQSLAPFLAGEAAPALDDRLLYAHRRKSKFRPLDLWGLNAGRWRLIQDEKGELQIFDIETDPIEQQPLERAGSPEQDARLRKALQDYVQAGISDRAVMREVEQSEAERALLEKLGYAEDGEGG